MREQFQEELNSVSATLVAMAGLVKTAMENATTALLTADLALAERVIAEDAVVDEIQHELDARTINLIARQGPVASDLRTLVTSLRMSADLERMGDLAHHIAKSARMRYPATAVPPELSLTIEEKMMMQLTHFIARLSRPYLIQIGNMVLKPLLI
jgi:phosphate transport system protein